MRVLWAALATRLGRGRNVDSEMPANATSLFHDKQEKIAEKWVPSSFKPQNYDEERGRKYTAFVERQPASNEWVMEKVTVYGGSRGVEKASCRDQKGHGETK